MLELYQFEDCPYSAKVRKFLSDHGVDYILRNVPSEVSKRTKLMNVSGQANVPTLVDSERDVIIGGDEDRIIQHLERIYGETSSPPSQPSPSPVETPPLSPETPKGYG